MKLISQDNLTEARQALIEGSVLGVPTETVYGLAVSLKSRDGIKKLMRIKGRSLHGEKRLTLMLSDYREIPQYATWNKQEKYLANRFFPGELTMIFNKRANFKHYYYDSFDTIGIRVPAHKYMRDLIKTTGPLLVTSANPAGETPCLSSLDIFERMPEVDCSIEGVSGCNLPSTILDIRNGEPKILRQGGLMIVRYCK